MTMKKRITSFALVLLMVLSSLAVLLPVTGVKAAAAETKTYTKVTTAPEDGDWSGTYLIVCESEKLAFNGSLTDKIISANGVGIDIAADGSITTLESYAFIITRLDSGNYQVMACSGVYIGNNNNSNAMTTGAALVNKTISINSDGTVNIISNGGAYLRYNASSKFFRYYKSSTYANQKAICLYKVENNETPDHTHTEKVDEKGNTVYEYDVDKHYKICTDKNCPNTNGKYDAAAHDFTAWVSAGETEHTHSCKVCGAAYSEEHKWVNAGITGEKVVQNCECGATREVKLDYNAEIVFKNQGWSNQQVIDTIKLSNGVVITFNKGTNSNTPKYFTKGTEIRVYGGGYITIKAPAGRVISSITLTDGAGNSISANTGSLNSGVWSGAAETLTFTVDGTSGNYNFTGLNVKCADAPKIDSATLNIGTNIDVNYYVVLPEGISYEKYVMRFTFNGKTTNVESTTGDKFTFKNVGPHQMGLNISAVLYGVNGETETKLSEKATYSVKENLESLLASGNETVKTLAKNMLIYGAAAQKYTGAADADLVTSETHTVTPTLTSGLDVKNDATSSAVIKFVGMKLIFDNEPRLAIRYEIISDKYTASDIVFTDGNNNDLTKDGEYVYLNSVTANKFGTDVTITNNRDGSAVMLNVNTYVYYILKNSTDANMKALATALYYYGVAAEAYVNAQTTQQ